MFLVRERDPNGLPKYVLLRMDVMACTRFCVLVLLPVGWGEDDEDGEDLKTSDEHQQ